MSNGPFAYVQAINEGRDIEIGKDYNQYLINRAFSYHSDSLHFAGYLNRYHDLPNDVHFKFLRSVIKPKKRFSKWPKPTTPPEVKAVSEYFRISLREAEQYVVVLTKEQTDYIIEALDIGK